MQALTALKLPLGAALGVLAVLVAWVLGPLGLIAAGILGALGIQLVADASPTLTETANQRKRMSRIIRAWSIALVSIGVLTNALSVGAWLMYPDGALGLGASYIIEMGVLYVIAFGIAAAIGVWWPRVLERACPGGVRPGYIVAGLGWASFFGLRAVSWLPLLFLRSEDLRAWFASSTARGELPLLPLLFAIAMRLLYAGLPQREPVSRITDLRRRWLTATLVLVAGGFALAALFELRAAASLLTLELSACAGAGALIWMLNLRRSHPPSGEPT
jgi:hypothetical protein